VTVTPDTKDWTWVLARPCPECGFDTSGFPCLGVAGALRENAGAWQPLLELPDAGRRPTPSVWSALEYACHVRDVFRIFDRRLARILAEDDPLFENWDQDRTAVEDRYGEQDPGTVTGELASAGAALAQRFDGVTPDQWSRPGRRSDGASFTVDTFSRYLLHDPVHHLHDVQLGLQSIRGRR